MARARRSRTIAILGFAAIAARAGAVAQPRVVFTDIAREAGLAFRHSSGGCGRHFFAEQVGGGAAWLDVDGDDRLDLFLTSGVPLAGCPDGPRSTSRLFRNVGACRFVDGSEAAGIRETGFATGCAAGDYDNDGDVDLFVSCVGPSRLLRNDAAIFTDMAPNAGVADTGFHTSAAFLDFDRDGDLDLYVASYVDIGPGEERECKRAGLPVYCLPQDYPGKADHLYRNDGADRFTDVTREAGVLKPRARGLGVAVGDFDDDGFPDIYVANDTNENDLFRNRGNGTFEDRGLESGAALGENGAMENGMGADWGDFDGDARLDVVVTNFDGQTNSLYRNLGGGFFADVSFASGTGETSLPYVGWAAIFADWNLDGRLDLFITNGHVFENVAQLQEGASHAQPCLVYLNTGGGRFTTVKLDASFGFTPRVGRGAAAGDMDGDGDLDVAINNLDAAPFLLRNDTPRTGKWLGLKLTGRKSNRSAIGARVTLRAGGAVQLREVKSGSGYLSQNDFRIVFGLGAAATIDSLEVRWPSGAVESIPGRAAAGAYTSIVEGNP